MTIRKLTIEDVNQYENKILDLFEQLVGANFPANLDLQAYIQSKPDEMRKYIENGTAIIFGSFRHDDLTGFIWGYKKDYFGEFRIHVAHAVVDKSVRNSTALVGLAFKMRNEAKALGAASVECMATFENEKLVEHYQRIGFEIERVSLVMPL